MLRSIISGAIFSPGPEEQISVKAFELALEYVNNQSTILPSTKLKYIVNQSAILDPLTNIQKGIYSPPSIPSLPHKPPSTQSFNFLP